MAELEAEERTGANGLLEPQCAHVERTNVHLSRLDVHGMGSPLALPGQRWHPGGTLGSQSKPPMCLLSTPGALNSASECFLVGPAPFPYGLRYALKQAFSLLLGVIFWVLCYRH